MKYIITLIFLFLYPLCSYSQSKIEIEKRVDTSDVPIIAQRFMDSLHFSSKIMWFVEQDYDRESFEAKTKYKGKKYSIEFDTLGKIEDIEIKIKWRQISVSSQKVICERLKKVFSKYKIKKIQIQYTGTEKDLINFYDKKDRLTTKYEIIVKGMKENQTSLYEFLFSEDGKLESQRQIDFRNTDHLEY